MKILGVDCSTKLIAIFSIEDGTGSGTTFSASKDEIDSWFRAQDMFRKMVGYIMKEKPDMVYVENSPYLQNIKTTLQIYTVVDAVRFACSLNSVPVQTVEVTSWKKDILGNGKASKEAIMEFAKAKWGAKIIKNQDIADAACICLYGWKRMGENV